MAQVRAWATERRKAIEAEIVRLTAGEPSVRTRFIVDRVGAIYHERLTAGDTPYTASQRAWIGVLEECQSWAEQKGLETDPEERFKSVSHDKLEPLDIVRDMEWVLESLGRTNVRKMHAPSGNAWNLYSTVKEDGEFLKQVMGWAMKVIRPVPNSEGQVEGDEEEMSLDDVLGGG